MTQNSARDFDDIQGALTTEYLRLLVEQGLVVPDQPLTENQFQPSSLDLTLSAEGYKLPGSILPLRGESVRDALDSFHARPIDLTDPIFLDRGQVYLIRLNESLRLPKTIGAYTNNKSSTGRIDLQTRTISDGNPRYEKHARGYHGDLWIEVISKSFDIRVSQGISLNQAIFYGERQILDDRELLELMNEDPLLFDKNGNALVTEDAVVDHGLMMSVDLEQDIVGFVAKKSPEPLLLDQPGSHDPSEFFDPITRPKNGRLLLMKGRFYILSTLEYLRVPTNFAVEMLPYETTAGEFRAHYAGFFDPGFGYGAEGEVLGTPAVLEVRPYDDDLILRHSQPICKMAYERLCGSTELVYGASGTNHYAHQRGPRLSKYFTG